MILRNMKISQEYYLFVDWQTFILWNDCLVLQDGGKFCWKSILQFFQATKTLISKKAQHSSSTTRLVTAY